MDRPSATVSDVINMKFSRKWAMPTADTFTSKPIAEFLDSYVYGTSVDPFARNSTHATYTNDLNPNTSAQFHEDAVSFLERLADNGIKADCILLDPPYSPRQISECYTAAGLKVGMKDTQNSALYKRVRDAARRLCKHGTIVLSFGWNSCGMGDGFEQIEIMLVAHGGAHNDTICLAERCVQPDLLA